VEAASLLLKFLKGHGDVPSTRYIDTELVVRGSTGKLLG
jgi:hypothetical protein